MNIMYSRFGESPELLNADGDLEDAEPLSLKKELISGLRLPMMDRKTDSRTQEERFNCILIEAGIDPASIKLAN
ncbi:hypothetical protein W822_22595 [Advenella kashmirensis W13003]|uniref:Uncharacterized protein n=1 Tax=Advenella kashmirensis W13003 TaxID=1424334 RepID=V8QLQ2_9BURK|nr:hypothetical protein [Advenella kashmirensis]ETF00562.1 hypothetical protein W822_22595 [Advenella kashmirensis W13003]